MENDYRTTHLKSHQKKKTELFSLVALVENKLTFHLFSFLFFVNFVFFPNIYQQVGCRGPHLLENDILFAKKDEKAVCILAALAALLVI